MNYLQITHEDVCNGVGLRVVLWLSGCSHHCYNCQNPQTWNPDSGIQFDESAKQEIFTELSKDYISGITFSGGDPLHENNLDEVLFLKKLSGSILDILLKSVNHFQKMDYYQEVNSHQIYKRY